MAASLEEILGRLLLPDNNAIQQATQELKVLYKNPDIIPALCQVLGTSTNAQIRQYGAVLLRKKILKSKQWEVLQGTIAQTMRENILQILLQEPEKSVRTAIAQVIATMAKHDMPTNAWPQLFAFITQNVKSEDPANREVGMYILYSVASSASEQLKPHLADIAALISGILMDPQSNLAPFYAVKTLSEVVFYVGDDALQPVQQLLPQILQVIQNLISIDEEKACEAFEVLDEMLECEVVIITPHLKSTVMFCLEISGNSNLEDTIRVKAMSFICSLTRLKKKQVLKNQLVLPVLNVMFPAMCDIQDGDEEESDDEEDVESTKPSHLASQVLDTMAMHLPPEKFIPPLMGMVEPALQDEKPERRKAAYIAMAVMAEGCADYVSNKMLKSVLQVVCKGLNDSNEHVRNSALFAIGQFSEHLQPDISKYAAEVLPLLFQYLVQASQESDKNPKGLTRSYYALEMFCQNLGKEIEPYLPKLMEHLLNVLKTSSSFRNKELAISALGATASAAEMLICPYFEEIINSVREFLVVTDSGEAMFKLQIQTIDTLGVLARCVGGEIFQPLLKESMTFGLKLLETAEDSDQRRCIYGLFAALSTILKADIGEYLQTMMQFMLMSLKTAEGVKAHVKEGKSFLFDDTELEDDVDIQAQDEEEDDSDIAGISVENAYMAEKEDTAVSMGEIAVNAGVSFLPYLEETYHELLTLLDYPSPRVQKGAVMSLGQYCFCVYMVNKLPAGNAAESSKLVLSTMLNTLVPKFLTIIEEDEDREVVMATVDVIHDLLEKLGEAVLQVPNATDQILTKMKLIFTHQVACQEGEEEEEEEQQAEFDSMLIESAGDVIPVMAKLIGGQHFLGFLGGFLPDLLKRMRQTSSVSEKSFAVGTLGETIEAIGPAAAMFSETLYPVFVKLVRDEDDEVRSNAVYSLGVLVSNCCTKTQGRYAEVLKILFEVLNKESNSRVQDNICGAVCRMINASPNGVPLDVVVPVVIKCMPLKEDYEENKTVYTCISQLFAAGNAQILAGLPNIISAATKSLGTEEIMPEVEKVVVSLVKEVAQKFPNELATLRGSLSPEQVNKLEVCLNAVNGAQCFNGGCRSGCC